MFGFLKRITELEFNRDVLYQRTSNDYSQILKLTANVKAINERLNKLEFGTNYHPSDVAFKKPRKKHTKLTDDMRQRIQLLKDNGLEQKQIAELVGVSASQVSNVLKGNKG